MRSIRFVATTATMVCVSVSLAARAQPPSSAYDMDVVRLKLGMSPEQIEAGIKAFNPNMQIREIREKSASGADAVRVIDAWVGSTEAGQSAQEIIVVFTRNEPIRAYEISKGSTLAPDEQLTYAEHLDTMRKRFGEPSNPFNVADQIGLPGAHAYVWAYDRDHRKIDAVSLAAGRLYVLCGGHGYSMAPPPYMTAHQITGQYETNLSDLLQVAYSFNPACGATYRRQFVVDPDSGRVLQLFQDLVSDEMALADLNAVAALAFPAPEPDTQQQTQATPPYNLDPPIVSPQKMLQAPDRAKLKKQRVDFLVRFARTWANQTSFQAFFNPAHLDPEKNQPLVVVDQAAPPVLHVISPATSDELTKGLAKIAPTQIGPFNVSRLSDDLWCMTITAKNHQTAKGAIAFEPGALTIDQILIGKPVECITQ
jgi:hypothetical protein